MKRPLHVVGAAILRDAECLVVQRAGAMSSPLKWEFPGGKVEIGETPEAALRREILEELALEIEVGDQLGRGTVPGSRGGIVLDVYRATLTGGQLELREHRRGRWLGAEELGTLDWAAADVPVVPAVAALLRRMER